MPPVLQDLLPATYRDIQPGKRSNDSQYLAGRYDNQP